MSGARRLARGGKRVFVGEFNRELRRRRWLGQRHVRCRLTTISSGNARETQREGRVSDGSNTAIVAKGDGQPWGTGFSGAPVRSPDWRRGSRGGHYCATLARGPTLRTVNRFGWLEGCAIRVAGRGCI